jgi:hypothetical protein
VRWLLGLRVAAADYKAVARRPWAARGFGGESWEESKGGAAGEVVREGVGLRRWLRGDKEMDYVLAHGNIKI